MPFGQYGYSCEGFFCLVSNKELTLQEALGTYRQKNSIEKIFHSLKNDWTKHSIYGAWVIGFLAQLFNITRAF
ncbi:hypothetical protein BMS3Abin16_00277 [archaeon BMS3Abin16]|nr:hypothetical protein BMS3Abin16_00277 [archaeon BMS3Abin16]HDY74685.1 hypothetical protein [Euryarchaeota archaeon]